MVYHVHIHVDVKADDDTVDNLDTYAVALNISQFDEESVVRLIENHHYSNDEVNGHVVKLLKSQTTSKYTGDLFGYYDTFLVPKLFVGGDLYYVCIVSIDDWGNFSKLFGPIPRRTTLPPYPEVLHIELKERRQETTIDNILNENGISITGNVENVMYFSYEFYIIQSENISSNFDVSNVDPSYIVDVYDEIWSGFNSKKPYDVFDFYDRVNYDYDIHTKRSFIDFTKDVYVILKTHNDFNLHQYEYKFHPLYFETDKLFVKKPHVYRYNFPYINIEFELNGNVLGDDYIMFFDISNESIMYDDLLYADQENLVINSTKFLFHTPKPISSNIDSFYYNEYEYLMERESNYTIITKILNTRTGEFFPHADFIISTASNIEFDWNVVHTSTNVYGKHLENSILYDKTRYLPELEIYFALIHSDYTDQEALEFILANTTYYEDILDNSVNVRNLINPLTTINQKNIHQLRNSDDGLGVYEFITNDTLLNYYQSNIYNERGYLPLNEYNIDVNAYLYVIEKDIDKRTLFKKSIDSFPSGLSIYIQPNLEVYNKTDTTIEILVPTASVEYTHYVLASSTDYENIMLDGYVIDKVLNNGREHTSNIESIIVSSYYDVHYNEILPLITNNVYHFYVLSKHTSGMLFHDPIKSVVKNVLCVNTPLIRNIFVDFNEMKTDNVSNVTIDSVVFG